MTVKGGLVDLQGRGHQPFNVTQAWFARGFSKARPEPNSSSTGFTLGFFFSIHGVVLPWRMTCSRNPSPSSIPLSGSDCNGGGDFRSFAVSG
eukprot:TRINITY_DN4869_c0_g2_i1.p1 TRINITY_DN4869_c0_g2~~TRINITY_DN4869_c0_g2_i1.p1  ORF type:complete len:106 (-),score=3.66 TRINITY_DN4869_c0_g2_i1:123-398(-)